MMEDFISRLVSLPLAVKLLAAVLGIVVIHVTFHSLEKRLPRHFSRGDARYRVRKFVVFLGYVIAILFMAILFGDRLGRLSFALGIAGAGVAVALQEVIAGIAGWIAIGVGKLYAVGDRIQIGDTKGEVIDISPLRTTLMETGHGVSGDLYSGRIASIPNGAVLKGPTFNYSQGFYFVWNEIKLRFTLDSDHVFAREMLLQIARESVSDYVAKTEQSWEHVTDDFRIANLRREPTVTLVVVDGAYLEFTVSYVVDYLKRTVTKDQLFTRILEEIDKNESKVRWVSSSGPATPPPAPPPASQDVLPRSSSVAAIVAR
jgi:small-conductance mechanosensitive channel